LEDVRERMSRPANMRGGTFFKVGGGTSTQVHVKKLYKLHYFRQNFTTMKTYRLTT